MGAQTPVSWRGVSPWVLVPLGALLFASCTGSKLQSVSGKVLHKGNPIKGAVVSFHPVPDDIKAQRPTAVTAEDGTFTLMTGPDKGAAPGQYVVTVVWHKETPPSTKISMEPPPDPVDQLKGRYANAANSKINVEIKPGTTQLEPINLD